MSTFSITQFLIISVVLIVGAIEIGAGVAIFKKRKNIEKLTEKISEKPAAQASDAALPTVTANPIEIRSAVQPMLELVKTTMSQAVIVVFIGSVIIFLAERSNLMPYLSANIPAFMQNTIFSEGESWIIFIFMMYGALVVGLLIAKVLFYGRRFPYTPMPVSISIKRSRFGSKWEVQSKDLIILCLAFLGIFLSLFYTPIYSTWLNIPNDEILLKEILLLIMASVILILLANKAMARFLMTETVALQMIPLVKAAGNKNAWYFFIVYPSSVVLFEIVFRGFIFNQLLTISEIPYLLNLSVVALFSAGILFSFSEPLLSKRVSIFIFLVGLGMSYLACYAYTVIGLSGAILRTFLHYWRDCQFYSSKSRYTFSIKDGFHDSVIMDNSGRKFTGILYFPSQFRYY